MPYPELVLVSGDGDLNDEVLFIDRDYRACGVMPDTGNILKAFGPRLDADLGREDDIVLVLSLGHGEALTFIVYDAPQQMRLHELFSRRMLLDTPDGMLSELDKLAKSFL